MALDIKSYEGQARLSVILGAVGGLGVILAAGLMGRNYNATSNWIVYSPASMWFYAFGASLGLGLLASSFGFFIGLNSAGQKRNTQNRLSWIGFFVSAFTLTLGMCAASLFYFFRQTLG